LECGQYSHADPSGRDLVNAHAGPAHYIAATELGCGSIALVGGVIQPACYRLDHRRVSDIAEWWHAILDFKGKELFFATLVALMVIPVQSSLIPVLRGMVWVQRTFDIQLTGTYVSAWLVHSAFAMPLAIYTLRNFMMTLPMALIEAAKVDGASYYQIFWRLVLPMSAPAIASFAIFQFLWVWNDYLIAFIFVGEQKAVMTYRLLRLLGQFGQGWRDVAAGSFISLIIPLIVFFSLQRFIVRGLLAGSVKG
jgi:alpha-glucoside transport system permease protein